MRALLTIPLGDKHETIHAQTTEQERVSAETTEEEVFVETTEEEDVFVETTEQVEVSVEKTEQNEVTVEITEQERVSAETTEEEVFVETTEQEEVSGGRTEQNEVTAERTEQEEVRIKTYAKAQTLGYLLYHEEEFRCPENMLVLSEDLEFAEATLKKYISLFRFESCLHESLQLLLSVFWPDDEPALKHLLISHFCHQYLACNGLSHTLQPKFYNLVTNMIHLNDNLHGGNEAIKMTCNEFIVAMNRDSQYQYFANFLKEIYETIKMKPLLVSSIKTKSQNMDENETATPEDDPLNFVYKTGNLIRKRVQDKNGKKTKKGQRAWKPFTAVLKGMVLYLQKDKTDLCNEINSKNAIRLHHAVAYPMDYKKRPYVLCLRTADSGLFYFQTESEVEQVSWIEMINRIAACYSAPPLSFVSHRIKKHYSQILPSYPSGLCLKQQHEYYENQAQKLTEHIDFYLMHHRWNSTLDHMEQQLKRYTTYVKVLQELVPHAS